jgi:uncharacterized protein with FMN-binding domain
VESRSTATNRDFDLDEEGEMRKVGYILGGLAVIACASVFVLFNAMSAVKGLQIKDVDLSKVADGTHEGEFHQGRWSYKVAVSVKDHRITGIEILSGSAKMFQKLNQEESARVIAAQTPKVDVVSGATVTSKALLKAIENALTR